MSKTATAKAITIIPATIDLHRNNILDVLAKRRVAGYARVSTDQEEQQSSYEAQVDLCNP
jgi:predicted site-specific integrase-resolvase